MRIKVAVIFLCFATGIMGCRTIGGGYGGGEPTEGPMPLRVATYTTNLSLAKPAYGDPNWHIPLNANCDIIDSELGLVSGITTKVVAASDSVDAQNADYVCDGTDDDVDIENALTAVQTAGGGRVILLEGTYNLATSVGYDIWDDVTLEGQGEGTILSNNHNSYALYIHTENNVRVRNLSILQNAAGTVTNGQVYVFGMSNNIVFENIIASVAGGVASSGTTYVFKVWGCDDVVIRNCWASGGRGLYYGTSDNVLIEDCILENTSGDSAYHGILADVNGDRVTVRGCILHDGDANCNCAIMLRGEQCLVENNRIYDMGTGAGSCGIQMQAASHHCIVRGNIISSTYGAANPINNGIATEGAENTIISNNLCYGMASVGIFNADYNAEEVIISGNTIWACGGPGIFAWSDGGIISGNVSYNNATTVVTEYQKAGIVLRGDSMCVTGNRCFDDQNGGITSNLTGDAASGQPDVTVADGTLFWPGQCVTISDNTPDTEDNQIESIAGNVLTMTTNLSADYTVGQNGHVDGLGTQKYGVSFYNSGTSPANSIIAHNNLNDNTTSEFYNLLGANNNIISPDMLYLLERSADPAEPGEGQCVIWLSDGTGKGDDGDLLIGGTAGGATKWTTLFDHSGGGAW